MIAMRITWGISCQVFRWYLEYGECPVFSVVRKVFLLGCWLHWIRVWKAISLLIILDPKRCCAAAKSLQSCLTPCDPTRLPLPGILQARTLERAAISFFSAWTWKVKVNSLSRVRLLATPWTAAYQAPPSMGFSMQEYQNGLPLPSLLISNICFSLSDLLHSV